MNIIEAEELREADHHCCRFWLPRNDYKVSAVVLPRLKIDALMASLS
jgi:hypothetical protein